MPKLSEVTGKKLKLSDVTAMPDVAPDMGMRAEAPNPDDNRSWGQQASDAAFGVLHGLAQIPIGIQQAADQYEGARARMNPFKTVRDAGKARFQEAESARQQRESDYQSGPNSGGANLGGFVGNIVPYLAGPEAKLLDSAGAKAAKVLPSQLAANPLARKVASGATQGAMVGASQPVTTPGDFASQKAAQVGVGAFTGGAIPTVAAGTRGAASVGQRIFDGLARPDAAAASDLVSLVKSSPNALAALMQQQSIPGYAPTVAERLAGAQDPAAVRAVQMERNARNANGAPFTERDVANNRARLGVLENLAGSDTQLEAAHSAREAATQPFIDANLRTQSIADRFGNALKALEDFSKANPKMGKNTLAAVNGARKVIADVRSGKMQEDDAWQELQDLAASVPEKVGGGPSKAMQAFDAAHAAINKNMVGVQPILDAIHARLNTGIGTNPTVAGGLRDLLSDLTARANTRGMVSADILDGIRQNASRYLAKHAPQGFVSNQETAGVVPIQNTIRDTLERAIPGYRDYLAAYAKHSQPITDMESVRGLLDEIGAGGRNAGGDPTASLAQLKALLSKDDLSRYGLSPSARQQIENVLSTVQDRSAINNPITASGPGTAGDSLALKMRQAIPRAMGSGFGATVGGLLGHVLGVPEAGDLGLAAMGMKAGDVLGTARQSANDNALAHLLLNPQAAAAAVGKAQQPNALVRLLQSNPKGRALLSSPAVRLLLPVSADTTAVRKVP